MKNNIISYLSGFTLSSLSMINGWIHVETAIEVAIYGFIGGLAGMLGKWFIQYLKQKIQKYLHVKN